MLECVDSKLGNRIGPGTISRGMVARKVYVRFSADTSNGTWSPEAYGNQEDDTRAVQMDQAKI